MAEAAVEATPNSRFFCHKCNTEISPKLPDYLCPRCHSGFIEILERQHESDSDSSEDNDYEFWELFRENSNPRVPTTAQQSSSSSSTPNSGVRIRNPFNPRHNRRRGNQDQHITLNTLLHSVIEQMLEASVDGAGVVFPNVEMQGFPMFLSSNPGDYAWGSGGLDAIITQLLSQWEGTGPPPLPQDKINQIPTVKITQEQCDKHLQCSVCMEDFRLDDSVRKLNCEHCYHEDCILPWLKLHATCPVCRKTLTNDLSSSNSYSGNSTRSNNESYAMQDGMIEEIDLTEADSSSRSNPRNNFMEDDLD